MSNPHDGKTKCPGRADFQQALQSMDTYMDISIDDLMMLTQRAEQFANRRISEAISVTHVMSRPVRTVHPETRLSEVAHLMVSERISGLPIVDAAGHLIGIITEADFLRALGVPATEPHHNLWQTLESLFRHLTHHGKLETPDDPVMIHMVKDVVCVQPEQDLHEVIGVMKQNRVKRVVVCDKDRQVVGMVTRSDLVRIFFDRYAQPRQG